MNNIISRARAAGFGRIVRLRRNHLAGSSRQRHVSASRAKAVADFWASSRGHLVKAILALGAMIVLLAPGAAMATLGGSARSIAADQQALGGQVRELNQRQSSTGGQALQEQTPVPSNPAYTVEQISTPTGVTVKEYLSANGTVFGVSWRGPRPPNLSQLLGSYFAEYQTAAASPSAQRGHLLIETENLVVETGGHMRDLRGRAYVPSLLPPGVSADEIQ
jgi:hypothetical protein